MLCTLSLKVEDLQKTNEGVLLHTVIVQHKQARFISLKLRSCKILKIYILPLDPFYLYLQCLPCLFTFIYTHPPPPPHTTLSCATIILCMEFFSAVSLQRIATIILREGSHFLLAHFSGRLDLLFNSFGMKMNYVQRPLFILYISLKKMF